MNILALILIVSVPVVIYVYLFLPTPTRRLNSLWNRLSAKILQSMLADEVVSRKVKDGIVEATKFIKGGKIGDIHRLKGTLLSIGLTDDEVNLVVILITSACGSCKSKTVSQAAQQIDMWSVKSSQLRRIMEDKCADEFLRNLNYLYTGRGDAEELIRRLEQIANSAK